MTKKDPGNLVLLGRTWHEGRMEHARVTQIHGLAIKALNDPGPEALTGAKTKALMQIRDLASQRP